MAIYGATTVVQILSDGGTDGEWLDRESRVGVLIRPKALA